MSKSKISSYIVFLIVGIVMQGCTKPYSVPSGANIATLDMQQIAKVERTGTIIIHAKHSHNYRKKYSVVGEEDLGFFTKRNQIDDSSLGTVEIEANKRLRLLVRNGYQDNSKKLYRCDIILSFIPKEGRKYQLLSYSDMSLGTKSTCITKVYDTTNQMKKSVQFSEYSKYVSQIQ